MAYSREFRAQCRRLYLSGLSADEVAEKMGLNPDTVYRWRKEEAWDDTLQDDTIEGLRGQINALAAADIDEMSDAQVRKLDRMTKSLERLERAQGRAAKGRKKSRRPPALSIEVKADLRARLRDRLQAHQARFFEDPSRFRILLKGRQTGFSYETAVEAVVYSMGLEERPADDQVVISASQLQSDIVKSYAETIMEEERIDYHSSDGALYVPGGKKVVALPSNPRTIQGQAGDLYLDEFAWHLRPKMIYDLAGPIITRGQRRLTVISTPYLQHDFFGQLFLDEGQYKRFSRHRVTIHDAIAAGVDVNIEELHELYDELTFMMLYECVWFSDEQALLSPDEVRSAFDDTALGAVRGEAWGGFDVGRYRDLSAVGLVEEDADKVVWLRFMESLRQKEFAEQRAFVTGLFEMYKIRRMAVDCTGIGLNIAEDLQKAFGGRIERVHFTRERKEEMALGVKRLFEQGRIRIPNDRDLVAHLHAIKRKPTEKGFTYDAERNEQIKHADLFWMLALATRHVSGVRKRIIDRVRILGR